MTLPLGSSSNSTTLTSSDDIVESHINSLRESRSMTATVGRTPNCDYYCDGTADDVQIQQALDAVDTAGGGKVLIKAGTYSLDAPLIVGDYTHIQGEGMGATILKMADGSWEALLAEYFVAADLPTLTPIKAFQAGEHTANLGFVGFLQVMAWSKHDLTSGSGTPVSDWSKYVTVSDMTWDANASNQTYRFDLIVQKSVGGGIGFYPGGWTTIQRVEVKNTCGVAISAYGAVNPNTNLPFTGSGPQKILDCFVHDGGIGSSVTDDDAIASVIVDDTGAPGSQVSGCLIKDSNLTGIMAEDTNRIKISNNIIWNVYNGIHVASAPQTEITNNFINITVHDGVYFSGSTPQCVISGNSIFGAGRYGIKASWADCRNNYIAFAGDVGIWPTGSNLHITDNHIVDPGQSDTATYKTGILIEKGLSNSMITGNHCVDDYATANNPKGVQTMDYGFYAVDLGGGRADNFLFANNNSAYAITANFNLDDFLSSVGYSTYVEIPRYDQSVTACIEGMGEKIYCHPMSDDAYYDLPTGVSGFGLAQIGDNQEYAYFAFATSGAVTLISNSTNAVNTDTDVKFCIFDNGTNVRIKNRLGSTLPCKFTVWFGQHVSG